MGISWKGNEVCGVGGGGGVISRTTTDRGRVVGDFSHFSHCVCVCLVFSRVGVSV